MKTTPKRLRILLVSLALIAPIGATCRAQEVPIVDTSPPGFLASDEAFRYVRARVDGADSPPDADAEPRALPDLALHGACVTLRLDGQVLGRGEALGEARSLEDATSIAIAQAREHLPPALDAVQRRARAQLWSRVCVSLELCGPQTRVRPQTFADLDKDVLAGLEGLCVREGDRVELRFPAQMLAANDSPASAAISLISALTGSPTLAMPGVKEQEAAALSAGRGLVISKFRVTHFAQSSPDAPAMLLTRGGRVTPMQEITADTLRDLARRVSAHLLSRRTQVGGATELFADRWPLQGRAGEIASPREKALVALALCESAHLEAPKGDEIPGAVVFAQELIIPMLSVDGRLRDEEVTPAAGAALLLAMDAIIDWTGQPRGVWWIDVRETLVESCRSCVSEEGAWTGAAREGERAIVVHALSVLGRGGSLGEASASDTARASAGMTSLLRETPPTQLVTHMPWLGRAALTLAGDGDVPGASALRQMRERVNAVRLTRVSALSMGLDVEGGLLFAGDSCPTIHGSRPLAFVARMLSDSRLTDERERLPELSRVLESARFLRQLAVDEWWAWIVAEDSDFAWGLRSSPIDQRQSAEGNALALVAISECVRAIDELSRRMHSGAGGAEK